MTSICADLLYKRHWTLRIVLSQFPKESLLTWKYFWRYHNSEYWLCPFQDLHTSQVIKTLRVHTFFVNFGVSVMVVMVMVVMDRMSWNVWTSSQWFYVDCQWKRLGKFVTHARIQSVWRWVSVSVKVIHNAHIEYFCVPLYFIVSYHCIVKRIRN